MPWDDTKDTFDQRPDIPDNQKLQASEWNQHVSDGHFPSDEFNFGIDGGDPVITDPQNADQVVLRYDRSVGSWTLESLSAQSIDTDEVNSVQWADADDGGQGIEDAIDRIGDGVGGVALQPGAVYEITSPITVDVTNVRGIIGNGAVLEVDDDITALHLVGNVTGGGGSPGGPHDEREEQWPFVENLHIRGPNQDPYIGTGIDLENTYGAVIRGCSLYNLDTGLAWTDYNRNATIHNNTIWDNHNYGIHFKPGHNIHQLIIANNHIHYADIAVYDQGDDMTDLLFIGNGLEFGMGEQKGPTHALKIEDSSMAWHNVIVGNWFQDHGDITESLVHISGDVQRLLVNSNEFADTDSGDALVIDGGDTVSISDNFFDRIRGTGIVIDGDLQENYSISGNVFENVARVGDIITDGGGFSITGNSVWDCNAGFRFSDNIISLSLSGNVFREHDGPLIELLEPEIFYISIDVSGNVAHYDGGSEASDAILIDGGSNELRNVTVTNNTVRARSGVDTGISVGATGENGIIVKNNIVYDAATGFDIPDDTPDDIIVADNIDHS